MCVLKIRIQYLKYNNSERKKSKKNGKKTIHFGITEIILKFQINIIKSVQNLVRVLASNI